MNNKNEICNGPKQGILAVNKWQLTLFLRFPRQIFKYDIYSFQWNNNKNKVYLTFGVLIFHQHAQF